jgi:putative ABC transport system permease protein
MRRDVQIAWRNVRQYRTRLASLTLIVGLGCVIALGSVGFVARAANVGADQITSSLALRTIDIYGGVAHPGSTALTSTRLDAIRRIPHATDVQPSLQASFAVKNKEIPGALFYGTVPQPSALPRLVGSSRKDIFPLRSDEVVLPDSSQGVDFRPFVGRRLDITFTRQIAPGAGTPQPDRVTVVAVYDHNYTADGPTAAYAPLVSVAKWAAARAGAPSAADYLSSVGYQQAAVIVDTTEALPTVENELAAQGYQAISVQQKLAALPRQVVLLKDLGITVLGLLLFYSAVTGISLASSFIRLRTRELGLLKAIGFARRRVFRILAIELLLIGLIPAAVGVIVGNVGSLGLSIALRKHELLGVILPSSISPAPWHWSLVMLVAPVLAVLLGGLWPARRSAALEADVALREWR